MSGKLKNVILWTLYIVVLIIGLSAIIALGVNVLAPTFFPDADISGFKNYINTFGIILSFLSVGLGMFSIYQANISGKQAVEMLNSIQELKIQQERMLVSLKSIRDSKVGFSTSVNGQWELDDVDR